MDYDTHHHLLSRSYSIFPVVLPQGLSRAPPLFWGPPISSTNTLHHAAGVPARSACRSISAFFRSFFLPHRLSLFSPAQIVSAERSGEYLYNLSEWSGRFWRTSNSHCLAIYTIPAEARSTTRYRPGRTCFSVQAGRQRHSQTYQTKLEVLS